MSLTKLDSEIFIRISHTKAAVEEEKKREIDYDNEYVKWKRRHPALESDASVDSRGTVFYLWTVLVCSAVSFNLLAIPGYVYILDDEIRTYWMLGNLAADAIYLCDILVQSRLRYFEDGCEQHEAAATRGNYYQQRLLLDVVSVCPLELLLTVIPFLPLLRLNRLLKINRLLDLFSLAEGRLKAAVVSCLRIIFLCTLIFHWNACGYFFLGTQQDRSLRAGINATFDDDTEWGWPFLPEKITDVWTADCQMQCNHEFLLIDEEREVALMDLYEKWDNRTIRYEFDPAIKEYVQSFYWSCMTITTLGEQPSPDDTIQTVFETFDTLLGMVVFAGIMGSVGALVGNSNRVEADRKQFMDGLKQFMGFRGVSDEIRQRVLRHCADELIRGQRLQDSEVKEGVPDRVFLAINRFTALLPLAQSQLFRGTGHAFLTDLGRQLISFRLGPGDVLARKGEEQKEMYIVARGQLVSEQLNGSQVEIKEGGSVGEEGLIWLGDQQHVWRSTIYSREYSQIFVLTRERLLQVLDDYPTHAETLQETAAQLIGTTVDERPPTTAERLLEVSEVVERLERDLERQYKHFINYSTQFKQRIYEMERRTYRRKRTKAQ